MTHPSPPDLIERRQSPDITAELSSPKRVYDPKTGRYIVKVFSGESYVSTSKDEMLATILGSCIAACIRDPITGIGGMNHFLLPGDSNLAENSDSKRYGVFAMESLINGILSAGGRKDRLEVKVFGGGNVIKSSANIGSKNAEFVRRFLRDEGIQIVSEDLEGNLPRRIHYFPDTGKVLMRKLRRTDDLKVAEEEERYKQQISTKPVEGDIDLF